MDPKLLWYSAIGKLAEILLPDRFSTFMRYVSFESFTDSRMTLAFSREYLTEYKLQVESVFEKVLEEITGEQIQLDLSWRDSVLGEEIISETDSEVKPAETIPFERVVQGLRQTYLHSERNHVLPAYLLRWLPYFKNPKLFWTLIGFRQTYYGIHRESPQENKPFHISVRQVSSLCGVDKDTVRKYRDKPILQWFFRYKKTNEYSFAGADLKRKAFPHVFVSTAPPTPQDQDALISWLVKAGIKKDPQSALKTLLDTPASEILVSPTPVPEPFHLERKPEEISFEKLILSLCSLDILEQDDRARIISLAAKAADYLVSSFGLVFIPLYFLQHWVPLLGHTPALAALLLRRTAGYYNPQTNELRDEGVLKGGIKSLALRMGVSEWTLRRFFTIQITRPSQEEETLSESYAYYKQLNLGTRELFNLFVPDKQQKNGNIHLKINMFDPLVPAHEEELDCVAQIIARFMAEPAVKQNPESYASVLMGLLAINDYFCLIGHISPASSVLDISDVTVLDNSVIIDIDKPVIKDLDISAIADIDISAIIDLDKSFIGDLEISDIGVLDNAVIRDMDKWVKRFRHSSQFKIIKYLQPNTLKQYLIHITTPLPENTNKSGKPNNDPRMNWKLLLGERWDVSRIIQNSSLSQKEKDVLIELAPAPEALISYLLLVYGPEKTSFKHPWKFVSSKLKNNPRKAHTGMYSYLARLSPTALRELLQHTCLYDQKLEYEGDQSTRVVTVWKEYIEGLKSSFDMCVIAENLELAEWK